MPRRLQNSVNSWLANGGPLSVLTSSGMPNSENVLSSDSIVHFGLVVVTSFSTGKRYASSLATHKKCPFASGP
jgi:hypothetical protein